MLRPRDRLLKGGLAAAVALMVALVWPASANADHCGGKATVTPERGPVGTEFVFETNQGAPTNLRFFHGGVQVVVVTLPGDGFVSYTFVAAPGDEGEWRARAEVQVQPDCYGEATFVVDGGAATSLEGPLGVVAALAAGAVVMVVALAVALAVRRRSRSGGS
ncbi:MAG: hypothetical protein AB1627_05735 [Chloroflexota bacterium]